MTIQQAIEKAIEGGWNERLIFEKNGHLCDSSFLLDPLFWQSLGKAMWWDKLTVERDGRTFKAGKYGLLPEFVWQGEWHRFIDHLAEGKDQESFFENL